MYNRPIAAVTRQSLISAVALAGLNALAVLYSVEPATAGFLSRVQTTVSARQGQTCQDKHAACTRRCIEAYDKGTNDGYGADRCVTRTCDRQLDNCKKEMGQTDGSGKNALPPLNSRPPRTPFSMPSGGILSSSPGLPSHGPAPTGTPIGGAPAAPSAPLVIIR
jgi:hypothetical protein